MQVILTQDVENLGGANEVVEVASGYARNYLLPRGLAMAATKSSLANIENMKAVHERREAKKRTAAEEQAAQLQGKSVRIPARVGSEGRLYGSVGTADIADALKAQFGLDVDRRQVQLEDPIRMAGLHTVPVKLHRDVQVDVSVQVGDAQ